jgi:putative beta-lysine N-acetyltransferase
VHRILSCFDLNRGSFLQPQADTITTLGHSRIQFGPLNDRVYLMELDCRDLPGVVAKLVQLARGSGLTKICAKVPLSAGADFVSRGFVQEALAPGLFQGRVDGLFLARFMEEWRSVPDPQWPRPGTTQDEGSHQAQSSLSSSRFEVREMGQDRVQAMAEVFRHQFSAYPFPVSDPDYLQACLQTHVRFFGIEVQGRIAALASSETNTRERYVEMTDFITLPAFRGLGLATALLQTMEQDMAALGFITAFSIARAGSAGMNATFARQGYVYGGRLVKNTCFNGRLEDMNVWVKRL